MDGTLFIKFNNYLAAAVGGERVRTLHLPVKKNMEQDLDGGQEYGDFGSLKAKKYAQPSNITSSTCNSYSLTDAHMLFSNHFEFFKK